ncbi:MAG: hypothetical protein ABI349_13510 [Casimicrobiaceae bacterium]
MLDLVKHPTDVGRGKSVAGRRAHYGQLFAGCRTGFAAPRRAQRLTNPLGGRHLLPASRLLDFSELLVLQDDLEAFTHPMSLID